MSAKDYVTISLAMVVGIVIGVWPTSKDSHEHQLRTYVVQIKGSDKPIELLADSIERQDGCVVFKRGSRIDTIMCAGMDSVIVTEKN